MWSRIIPLVRCMPSYFYIRISEWNATLISTSFHFTVWLHGNSLAWKWLSLAVTTKLMKGQFCATSKFTPWTINIAESFSFGFPKCHFLFSCDTAWAVCSAGPAGSLRRNKTGSAIFATWRSSFLPWPLIEMCCIQSKIPHDRLREYHFTKKLSSSWKLRVKPLPEDFVAPPHDPEAARQVVGVGVLSPGWQFNREILAWKTAWDAVLILWHVQTTNRLTFSYCRKSQTGVFQVLFQAEIISFELPPCSPRAVERRRPPSPHARASWSRVRTPASDGKNESVDSEFTGRLSSQWTPIDSSLQFHCTVVP